MKSFKSVVNTGNIDAVRKTLNVGMLEIKDIAIVNKNLVYQKYTDLINWYNKFIGTEELRKYQNQVTDLQEKLFQAQENRRKIGYELSEIRNRSHEIQDQLHKINRQNNINKFLELLKEETEIMKKEQEISNIFNNQDRSERDIFTAFTNAIHNAHEKQRAQLENTKYFGIFISFLGSFLSFVYSSIKKTDLMDAVQKNMEVGFEPIQQKMEKNFENVETSFVKMQQVLKLYEDVLNSHSESNIQIATVREENNGDQTKSENNSVISQEYLSKIKERIAAVSEKNNGTWEQWRINSKKGWDAVSGASQYGFGQAVNASQEGLSKIKETLITSNSSPENLNEVKQTMTESGKPNKDELLRKTLVLQQIPVENSIQSSSMLKNTLLLTLAAVCALTMTCMVR